MADPKRYREQRRKWYKANRKKNREQQRKWRHKLGENPFVLENSLLLAGLFLQSAQSSAKKRDLEFRLVIADLLPLPSHCPILGVVLDYHAGIEKWAQRASLDRIDNSKGYISGNVAIISRRANTLKGDGTLDEVRAVLVYMEAHDAFPY